MPDTEIELKRLLVGLGAADRLIGVLGAVERRHQQINYIFDTSGRALDQQRLALRLRIEDGVAILTAKGRTTMLGAATSVRVEAEARVADDVAREILAGKRDALQTLREHISAAAHVELTRAIEQACGGAPLAVIGEFSNVRRVVPVTLPSGLALLVELDHTTFPNGRIDDEVEIEVPAAEHVTVVEAWLTERAAKAGVTLLPSTQKIARFFAALSR